MQQRILSALCAGLLLIVSVACESSAPLTPTTPQAPVTNPPGGATLKATTPTPQQPANNVRLDTFTMPTLVSSSSSSTNGGSATVQYRFQLLNDSGGVIQDSGLRGAPNWTPTANMEFDKRYAWQVRSEFDGAVTAWSNRQEFLSPNGGFVRGQEIFDPLTNGRTVGTQIGGHFVQGRGWQADTFNDGVDYTIPSCGTCTVEFDVTNFSEGEGGPYEKDLKFISMGDAPTFGDFLAFRDHPWKMHLEQRGDGDGTGMKLIWRNGEAGDDEPGDHTGRFDCCGPRWRDNAIFHFTLTWTPSGFEVWVGELQSNGTVADNKIWFKDGFGGHAYLPPTHRISLGTRTRSETLAPGIWSNFKVYPGGRR